MGYARLLGITVLSHPDLHGFNLSYALSREGILHHPPPVLVSCSCQPLGYPPSRLSRCASASSCRPASPALVEPAARAAATRSCTSPTSTCVTKGVCTNDKRLYDGHGYSCPGICRYACAVPTVSHPHEPSSLPGATPALGRWPCSLSSSAAQWLVCVTMCYGQLPCSPIARRIIAGTALPRLRETIDRLPAQQSGMRDPGPPHPCPLPTFSI